MNKFTLGMLVGISLGILLTVIILAIEKDPQCSAFKEINISIEESAQVTIQNENGTEYIWYGAVGNETNKGHYLFCYPFINTSACSYLIK